LTGICILYEFEKHNGMTNVKINSVCTAALHVTVNYINPLKTELKPLCHLLALIGAHHILHVSRIRVKILCRTTVFLWRIYVARDSKPNLGLHVNCPIFLSGLNQICGPGSSVGIATGYGLDGLGIEYRWRARFSAHVQTGPGAYPASCTMGTGSFLRVKSDRGVTLTPHPLLVPWSWKSRAIPLLPLWAVFLYFLTKFGFSRQIFMTVLHNQTLWKSVQQRPCWYIRTDRQTDEQVEVNP